MMKQSIQQRKTPVTLHLYQFPELVHHVAV